jgi:hypothetical protein
MDYFERMRRQRRVNVVRQEPVAPRPAGEKKVTETQRILALPKVSYDALQPGQMTARLAKTGGKYTLFPIQEQALHAIEECGGGFFPIGVGHGKSFIACLAATVLEADYAIILAPASTVRQLQGVYDDLRAHFKLVPAKIMSYAMLSRPNGTGLLRELTERYSKIALVCDEAHRLKRLESARTKRVIRYMKEFPETAFVALSGTMTSKSLKDFSHLSQLALRENSPVPRDRYHLETWSQVIDVEGLPGRNEWRMITPLVEWAGMTLHGLRGRARREAVRQAFQARMRATAGVVASTEGSIGCSLNLHLLNRVTVPDRIQQMMLAVADPGVDPGGEIIPDEAAAWRTTRNLAAGFYYIWDWPDGEDLEWLRARRDWNRWVRRELLNHSAEGYDSPFLVANRVIREIKDGQNRGIHRSWNRWAIEKQKPTPPTLPVWVDRYLIKEAVSWMNKQKEPVLLWYESRAIGEELERQGLQIYGAGANPPNEAHDCAMSIKAHGIGKNLQSWSNQLVIEPPTGGLIWEQLLGRTHRIGQEADEVECSIYTHVEPYARALATAKEQAKYISDASGNTQKLLFATFAQ